MARPVHIGCAGWNYRDWRGLVYPEKLPARRWLEHYGTLFGTVEINATFYRLPTQEAVANWASQTPDDFVFAIKGSRYLTHIKRLNWKAGGAGRLSDAVQPLRNAGKMGPMLWQLPASFHRDDERLAGALAQLADGRHCFEFRHESWFCDEVYDLLRANGVALVISDDPERPFQTHELTADWTYIRLHRGNRGRRGNYSKAELDTWARRIAAWRSKHEVFAYFNNDREAFAARNARELDARLSS